MLVVSLGSRGGLDKDHHLFCLVHVKLFIDRSHALTTMLIAHMHMHTLPSLPQTPRMHSTRAVTRPLQKETEIPSGPTGWMV